MMNIDLDKLKRLFQGHAAAQKSRSREDCPSAAELTESFEPSCRGRRKRKIIDHITSCPPCRDEFMMLLERQRRESASPEAAPEDPEQDGTAERADRRCVRRSFLWQYAGAVLGLGLIVVSLIVVKDQWDRSLALRGTQPQITLAAPRPGQVVSGPFTFRWKSQAHSDHYVLELFDEALWPIWTSEKTANSRLEIPAGVFSRLSPGKTYYWMVTGFSGQVKKEESPLGRFSVR